eukprot:TRINITY_DN44814_c0_g1_i1.p1 TRINITY_DN44814_c0_g1~~TRINITY_DN44814_c0_g1_i1.p1  ORF type:complete len:260 (+),score=36.44 TRINITY_DN44814_c0_g1_i1:75-854(+)
MFGNPATIQHRENVCASTEVEQEIPLNAVLQQDDLFICVLSFLDVGSIAQTSQACSQCSTGASADVLWLDLCRRHWASKTAQYHLTDDRQAHLSSRSCNWKDHYKEHEEDGKRARITAEELSSLTFDFTFRIAPNIRRSCEFQFREDGHVYGHPQGFAYAWKILSDGGRIALGPFPVADVHRRDDWGWVVCNVNIVCCSMEPGQFTVGSSAAVSHPRYFAPLQPTDSNDNIEHHFAEWDDISAEILHADSDANSADRIL